MIVSIGTRSIPKVSAITRAFSRYPELWIKEEKIEYLILPEGIRKDIAKRNRTRQIIWGKL